MRVYFTIFAGRKRYLDCLFPYLQKCIQKELIYEVHLWDYARTKEDSEFLKEYSNTYPKFVYIKPSKDLPNWKEYYLHYTSTTFSDDDILIKCDDDVVYIDVEKMETFIQSIDSTHLFFPNIINNDVCALIQTKLGVAEFIQPTELYPKYTQDVVPLTGWENGWFKQFEKAKQSHEVFLHQPEKCKLNTVSQIPWYGRFSINFVAAKFTLIRNLFALFIQYSSDDEAFISLIGLRILNTNSIVIPSLTVVHFSFGPQKPEELDKLFLESYYKLANS